MAVNVETLDKLERRITLSVPSQQISSEVETRLKKLSRTVKAAGFRPGKVPMSVVAQRYGYSVHYEVMNDHVGRAFNDAASEAQLRAVNRIPPRMLVKAGSTLLVPRTARATADVSEHIAENGTLSLAPEFRARPKAAVKTRGKRPVAAAGSHGTRKVAKAAAPVRKKASGPKVRVAQR
mgnify:CR=1 FL=1